MLFNDYVDIFLTAFTGIFALIVVFGRNPVVCALSLLMSFIGFAGIYFQLGSVFLTTIQVLIYAGAIAILFIFVLMLINTSDYKYFQTKKSLNSIIGTILCFVLMGGFTLVINNNIGYLNTDRLKTTSMNVLFESLFNKYMVPFELATILLLAAIVATIIIASRKEDAND